MDKLYVKTFLEPLYECLNYKPKFGNSSKKDGYSLPEFISLYSSDPFYSWIGLNNSIMYTAHKASGCMTSIYRQLGVGCERLFRQIIIDSTQYESKASACWSYTAKTKSGKDKTLSLDGRLEIEDIKNPVVKCRVVQWISKYCDELQVEKDGIKGAVFEVRQGYKSKDSKRQNGDIDNIAVAYSMRYLPVITVFSSQIDNDVVLRYRNNKSAIITGALTDSSMVSLYAFCKDVLCFDLAAFFERNSDVIKREIGIILEKLFKDE